MENKHWMKVSEVAAELGVTAGRVYQLINMNAIPAVKVTPHSVRIPRAAWQQYLAEQEARALASMQPTQERGE